MTVRNAYTVAKHVRLTANLGTYNALKSAHVIGTVIRGIILINAKVRVVAIKKPIHIAFVSNNVIVTKRTTPKERSRSVGINAILKLQQEVLVMLSAILVLVMNILKNASISVRIRNSKIISIVIVCVILLTKTIQKRLRNAMLNATVMQNAKRKRNVLMINVWLRIK